MAIFAELGYKYTFLSRNRVEEEGNRFEASQAWLTRFGHRYIGAGTNHLE